MLRYFPARVHRPLPSRALTGIRPCTDWYKVRRVPLQFTVVCMACCRCNGTHTLEGEMLQHLGKDSVRRLSLPRSCNVSRRGCTDRGQHCKGRLSPGYLATSRQRPLLPSACSVADDPASPLKSLLLHPPIACGHTTLSAPVLVRSPKLTRVGPA